MRKYLWTGGSRTEKALKGPCRSWWGWLRFVVLFFFMLPIKMSPKKEGGLSPNSRVVLKNKDCFLIPLKIKIRLLLKEKISVIIFLAIYICVLSAESWSQGKINEAWCVLRFLHVCLESSTSGKLVKFLHCSSIRLWMNSKLKNCIQELSQRLILWHQIEIHGHRFLSLMWHEK